MTCCHNSTGWLPPCLMSSTTLEAYQYRPIVLYVTEIDYLYVINEQFFVVIGQRIWWMIKSQSGELLLAFMEYLQWSTCCCMSLLSQRWHNSHSDLVVVVCMDFARFCCCIHLCLFVNIILKTFYAMLFTYGNMPKFCLLLLMFQPLIWALHKIFDCVVVTKYHFESNLMKLFTAFDVNCFTVNFRHSALMQL